MSQEIDDDYWLAYAKKVVDESLVSVDKSISGLGNYIVGLMLFYSSAAIFTVEYKEVYDPWFVAIFALPYIVVLIGKWQTSISLLSKEVSFDYRSPEQIEEAYNQTFKANMEDLKKLRITAGIATMAVAFVLIVGFAYGNEQHRQKQISQAEAEAEKEKAARSIEPMLKASMVDTSTLAIEAHYPECKRVAIRVFSYEGAERKELFGQTLMRPVKGMLFLNLPIPQNVSTLDVESEWVTDEEIRQIKQTVIRSHQP